jgi:phage/plasmid-like protein (TIGR03299 family)
MSSGIEESDQMFSVRVAPWHLGVQTTEKQVHVLDEYPGREEAMKQAGHDFLVQEEDQYRRIVRVVEGVETATFVKVDGYKYLVSSKGTDNNKVLHSARDTYSVVQPGVLYDLTEAILEADDDVLWETGGTLREGAVLWTLAKVNKPYNIGTDPSPYLPYVAASTTNDGSGGVKVQNINTRIVCMNTFAQSERESSESGREFTFRHTKNVGARIEKAKEILAGANRNANRFRELGEELCNVVFTDAAIEQFITEFIPDPTVVGGVVSDRVKNNIEEARGKVKNLFNSPTIDESIRNTGWGAVQVAVEYQQHLRKFRNDSTYLGRTLLNVESLTDRILPTVRRIADENKVGALV